VANLSSAIFSKASAVDPFPKDAYSIWLSIKKFFLANGGFGKAL
jgi:hypothetical protein